MQTPQNDQTHSKNLSAKVRPILENKGISAIFQKKGKEILKKGTKSSKISAKLRTF